MRAKIGVAIAALFIWTIAAKGQEVATESSAAVSFPIIDVHTHVFNTGYLPLEGILIAQGVPRWGARGVAKFLLWRTSFTDFSDSREAALATDLIGIADLSEEAAKELVFEKKGFEPLTKKERDDLGDYLAEELRQEGITAEEASDRELISRTLKKAGFGSHAGKNIFNLLYLLTLSEVEIVQQMQKEYPQVSLFIHHMMDMARTYDDRPAFKFVAEQVPRMKALNEWFPGRLLFLTAFDPFRREQAVPNVQKAMKKGAIGVKFYPPSGYRASLNQIPELPSDATRAQKRQWTSRYYGLQGEDLDDLNEDLFTYCQTERIPIFTHCTPSGFEAASGYGLMSDPEYWKNVFIEYPDLIVCFAHGGGGSGWFSAEPWGTDDPTFDEKVYHLVTQYKNAYLGFGYSKEILDAEKRENLRLRFRSLFPQGNQPFSLGDKIIYGTDWHMVARVAGRREILTKFVELFKDSELQPWQEKFFAENAARFLRLEDYAKRSDLSPVAKQELDSLLTRIAEGEVN